MLQLTGRLVEATGFPAEASKFVVRLSDRENRPAALRRSEAFLCSGGKVPEGYRYYLVLERDAQQRWAKALSSPTMTLPDGFDYLADGDVIAVDLGRRSVRALYRAGSLHNNFLLTERCNHYCLMCSQPPKDIDDRWIVEEMLETIPLLNPNTKYIGFTGGEPTLLGDDLIRILRATKNYLPSAAIHVLSNGRRFCDSSFVEQYASINHRDMSVGIPIYSDISWIHDYVVQADGAFDETIRGILNLKRHRQRVEIRVVIHRQTYERLVDLAEFVARNLAFVDHVALMGLEITGFTRANLQGLWIDPHDYREILTRATLVLASHGMNVSIFNHPLCLLDREVWPYARKSISDWKNEYFPECEGCAEIANCGGFFSSARLRHSSHIKKFRHLTSDCPQVPSSEPQRSSGAVA